MMIQARQVEENGASRKYEKNSTGIDIRGRGGGEGEGEKS